MVDVLKDLKENHYVVGVKAEFEAEGTRMEEALRLKEVVTKAGLDLTIKIGGCEAIKDMYDARSIGVSRIVAPMIESEYALKKYLQATHTVFPKDEWDSVDFLINIETKQSYENLDAMLSLPELGQLTGIVVGRVDLSSSYGYTRDSINTDVLMSMTHDILKRAKAKGKECVVGGGLSAESLPYLRQMQSSLDKYETRKVMFELPGAIGENADKGILKAVGFELMWLKNKREFYRFIYDEDAQRIDLLEERYKKAIEKAGGQYK